MSKILLVEDDEIMSDLYQTIFTLEKHEITIAKNGEEALQKVKQINPAIILLDVIIPKLNGFQVLAKLKNDPDTKSIPVVMFTNLAMPEEIENALRKGAIKYLIKSEYTPKEVTTIIKNLLETLSYPNTEKK